MKILNPKAMHEASKALLALLEYIAHDPSNDQKRDSASQFAAFAYGCSVCGLIDETTYFDLVRGSESFLIECGGLRK